MGRSQETFNKKEVRNKKEKKRKEKVAKRLARKDSDRSGNLDDMIAYVDENGMLTSAAPDPTVKKTVIKLEDIEVSVPKGNSQADEDPVRKGTVTFFNDSKGYGFIKDMETKQNVFVHAKNVLTEIKEGNLVTYEVEMGQRGPTATQVQISK